MQNPDAPAFLMACRLADMTESTLTVPPFSLVYHNTYHMIQRSRAIMIKDMRGVMIWNENGIHDVIQGV